jgi:hypothetical protein
MATSGFSVETGGGFEDVFAPGVDDAAGALDVPDVPELGVLESLQALASKATQTAATDARVAERTRIIHSPSGTTGLF